jgi:hypothetical protein
MLYIIKQIQREGKKLLASYFAAEQTTNKVNISDKPDEVLGKNLENLGEIFGWLKIKKNKDALKKYLKDLDANKNKTLSIHEKEDAQKISTYHYNRVRTLLKLIDKYAETSKEQAFITQQSIFIKKDIIDILEKYIKEQEKVSTSTTSNLESLGRDVKDGIIHSINHSEYPSIAEFQKKYDIKSLFDYVVTNYSSLTNLKQTPN